MLELIVPTLSLTIESYRNVCYPPFLSGDRQKLEILSYEDFSSAQTN